MSSSSQQQSPPLRIVRPTIFAKRKLSPDGQKEEHPWKLFRGSMPALYFDDSTALMLRLTIPLSPCSRLGKFTVLPARYIGGGNTWMFETKEIAKEPLPRIGGGNSNSWKFSFSFKQMFNIPTTGYLDPVEISDQEVAFQWNIVPVHAHASDDEA